jgi:hypothetical protein
MRRLRPVRAGTGAGRLARRSFLIPGGRLALCWDVIVTWARCVAEFKAQPLELATAVTRVMQESGTCDAQPL